MSRKNWIVLGVCTFVIITVNQFFHYADMGERIQQRNSSRQEKSVESLLEIEKQKLISKCLMKEGATQEFCQCLGNGVYSRVDADEMAKIVEDNNISDEEMEKIGAAYAEANNSCVSN